MPRIQPVCSQQTGSVLFLNQLPYSLATFVCQHEIRKSPPRRHLCNAIASPVY